MPSNDKPATVETVSPKVEVVEVVEVPNDPAVIAECQALMDVTDLGGSLIKIRALYDVSNVRTVNLKRFHDNLLKMAVAIGAAPNVNRIARQGRKAGSKNAK